MKAKGINVGLLVLFGLGGCGTSDVIDGPYHWKSTDIDWDTMICYDVGEGGCVGRVDEAVFAVGFDRDYIVAARHPHRFDERSLDRSKTEYYYIVRAKDGPKADPSAAVVGPLDKAAFDRDTGRLRLPPLSMEKSQLR